MNITPSPASNPGEQRTRARKRREILTYIFAGVTGGVIGAIATLADQGDGSLFQGRWEAMTLSPAISVVLAVALMLGLIAFPLWRFSRIDELVRQRNLVGYTGGMMVVMGGVPAWAVLHAGGFVSVPKEFGVWALGFAATFITFGYTWIKSR